MKKNGWHTAWRFGLPFGIGLAALGGIIGVARAVDHSHELVALNYVWILTAIICAFFAGLFAAREAESLSVGIRAGAIADALSTLIIFFIFAFGPTLRRHQESASGKHSPILASALLIGIILVGFAVVGGGLAGGLAGFPGALLGRRQARAERMGLPVFPEELISRGEHPSDFDESTLIAETSSADVIIGMRWPRALLVVSFMLAFEALFLALSISTRGVVGWVVVVLLGVGILSVLASMVVYRPRVSFAMDGVTYTGGSPFWQRGHILWRDLRVVALSPSLNRLFGRYELLLVRDGPQQLIRFLNWQVPYSVQKSLRIAAIRFRRQIEENDIELGDIELGGIA